MSDATAYLAIIFYNEKVVDRRIAQCLLGQLVTREERYNRRNVQQLLCL